MLREVLRLDAPELDVEHVQLNLRAKPLRVGVHRGRNTNSDYALLQRGSPFLHHLRRPEITILLEGHGRFEEDGVRRFLSPGQCVLSDQARGGTEAYGGVHNLWMVIDWDPQIFGAPFDRPFVIERLSKREVERLSRAARELEGEQPERAVITVLDVLRSWGMSFAMANEHHLREDVDPVDGALQSHLSRALSNLSDFPDSNDLVSTVGVHPRAFTRRLSTLARDYRMPWSHFRSALHHTRILQALRLVGAPKATTESVARLTGFRAPTALCHAFAKAGLPSPGVLGQAARKHALDAWTAF